MAKQVIKLGLEFDTKSAIASYRQLVSEMQKGGADPKAIKQFTAAIEKAETELAQLAAEGSTGFTDSKGIEQYQKKVLKTVTSMQQLALRMQDFSKEGKNFPLSEAGKLEQKIKDLKKAVTDLAEEAKKNLQTSLKNMGFSKTQAAEIANAVKNEEELKQRLEQERQLRQKNLDLAREQAQASVDAARGTKASSVESNSTRVKALTSGVDKISGVNPEAIKETVAEAFRSGIRKGVNNANDIVADLKKTFAQQFGEGTEITNALSEMLDKGLEASGDNISGWLNSIALKTGEALNPEKFKDLVAALNQVSVAQTNVVAGQFGAKMEESAQAAKDAATAEGQLGTATENTNKVLQQSEQNANGLVGTMQQAANSFIKTSDAEKQSLKSTEALEGGFNRLADRLKYMFGFTAMFNKLRQIIRSTFNDIQELDKAYASIAYVTNETVSDLWSTYGEYAGMAEKLGQSTADVIKASAIYRQQGLDTAEALELTTDTMKLATIAGNDYSTATQEMTAALRGFKMAMDEGSHVSDVYSELAAHAAASVDDIAQAMSRTASIANSAGMSFENTSAFLTQMIETTQESAENIGTSMKTIIARFTELKENVAGTADSDFSDLNFNKVDEALKSVGVSLKDTTGQFRNLDDVFLELSGKWDTLDRNTQRYIATVAAGSRQQSRFIAMMDNYERTVELIDIAADSEGRANEQFSKAADTIEFKLNVIKTKWEEFKLSVMDSSFMGGLLDVVDSLMDRLKNIKMPQAAIVAPFAIMAAKTFALNFIKTIKSTATTFSSIGKIIGKKISTKLPALKFTIDAKEAEDELVKIDHDIKALNARKNNLISIKVQVEDNIANAKANLNDLHNQYEQLQADLMDGAISEDEYTAAEEKLVQEIMKVTEDLEKQNAALEENTEKLNANAGAIRDRTNDQAAQQAKLTKSTIASQAASQALSATINNATLALSGYISGTVSGTEALGGFAAAMALSTVRIATQAATTAISAQIMAAGNNIASLSFKELAASAGAALLAMWPILAVMAGIAALAGVFLLISKAVDAARDAKAAATDVVALDNAISNLTKKQEELNQAISEQNEVVKEAKESYDKLEDGYDEFQKYQSMIVKTDEASENWLQTSKEIAEITPELIDHYDEEGNAILTSLSSAWEDALAKKRAYYEEQMAEEAELKVQSATNQLAIYSLQNEKMEQTRKDKISSLEIVDALLKTTKAESNEWDNGQGLEKNGGTLQTQLGVGNWMLNGTNIAAQYKNSDFEDWQFIKDAILEKGIGDTFGIKEDTSVREIGEKIEDKLAEGNDEDLENLKLALSEYWDSIDDKLQESKRQIEQQQKQVDIAVDNLIAANAHQNDKYNDSSKYVQNIMTERIANGLNIDFNTIQEEALKKVKADHPDWFNGNGELKTDKRSLYESAMNAEINSQISQAANSSNVNTQINNIEDKEIEFLEALGKKVTEDGIDVLQEAKIIEEGIKNGEITSETATAWRENNQNKFDMIASQGEKTATALGLKGEADDNGNIHFTADSQSVIDGFENFYNNLSLAARDALEQNLAEVANKSNQENAQKIAQNFMDTAKNTGASSDAQAFLLNQDWGTLDAFNGKESLIQQLANDYNMAANDAEKLFEATRMLKEETGEYNKFISSGDLAVFEEQLIKNTDALKSEADVFKDYLTSGDKTAKVTKDNYDKINKSFQSLAKNGVIISDEVMKWDEATGEYILDIEKLRKEFSRYTLDAGSYIDDQIAAYEQLKIDNGGLTEEEQRQLDLLMKKRHELQGITNSTASLLGLTETLTDKIEKISGHIDKASNAIQQFYKDGYVSAESLESIINIVGKNNIGKYIDENLALNEQALLDYVDAEIAALEAEQELTGVRSVELLQLKALRKEMENAKKEIAESSKDLEEKHQKALEDYAKAQQDVIDKQKALNQAIEDYNKLLYGSDNRQSGLDLLYNYKQAISAFADEMTRAQEILEDSKSVNEASSALSRYTNAAHQRLAYMQAEGTRYDAGLTERRSQLLSGATSYTNELTGNTTTINFGDYVKYNADTGLMAIDQKLIQDAKIADEWKDYIEKQVDDYNKLSQESLKNQDEIRKLEKEIQKRREDAIKKYADFEKDIAETLKAQYQEQVDNLKNKYDSMKEADDDYLDALQEAIEKQRKLRERENQWEDLAQKQKKLSLMQRDTSGANAIETQKLEKEIQKDREQLLDESIDSAIENMQKLAEKQDELRQTEVELKEALLENTMYWNQQAEGVAAGFETAEDYVEWFKQTAVGLNAETGAQFENTMNEARNKFGSASEEIAWRIQSDMSQTGDAVTETITVTGEEVENITKTTSDTFVDEVSNTFERTKKSFNDNMDQAIEKVHSAQTALQEAVNKLNEASAAAKAASEEIARLEYEMQHQTPAPETEPGPGTMDLGGAGNNEAAKGITNYMNSLGTITEKIQYASQVRDTYGDSIRTMVDTGSGYDGEILRQILDHGQISVSASGNGGLYNYLVANESLLKPIAEKWDRGVSSNIGYVSAKFEKGGLVNYTGPAWVDGSPNRPEAFLSADDTERIGNAAKLLSDIPALNRSNISTNNSTYGDTNIEINLNIDHISSDVDIEEMLDRVKQEIVDIARPVGTNVILQQQV